MLGVCPGVQEPALLKEKFAQYFKELNERSGKPYRIEASVGICVTNENEKLDFEQLVEKSDVLMYEEKERRRKKTAAGSGK